MSMSYLLDEGGPVKAANVVSLLRAALIEPIILLLLRQMNGAALWLDVLAVATDGHEGWLARRSGRCSEFGAVLDSSIDNVFSLSIAGFLAGAVGAALSDRQRKKALNWP